jgi:hypothetical protein
MLLVGLLLVVLSGAFAGLLIAYNTSGGPEYTVTLFDRDIATLDTLQVFVSGLALALVFCLGLWMMGTSARLRRARRQAQEAAVERDRFATDLGQQQSVRPEMEPDAGDTGRRQYAGAVRQRRSRRHLFGH